MGEGSKSKGSFKAMIDKWFNNSRKRRKTGTCLHEGSELVYLSRASVSHNNVYKI